MSKERLATHAATDHESLTPDSDEALMTRICEGDKEALGNLFHRYARLVRAVAFRILRDTSEADDLVQDVFVFIHRTCRRFDSSKATARSWVVQMTYQRAIDRPRYLMSRHFYSRADLDDSAIQLIDPATEPIGREPSGGDILGREVIHRVFESLPEYQRQILRLFFFEGYTFREIAAQRGEHLENVRHAYYRALEKLRKRLLEVPAGKPK